MLLTIALIASSGQKLSMNESGQNGTKVLASAGKAWAITILGLSNPHLQLVFLA